MNTAQEELTMITEFTRRQAEAQQVLSAHEAGRLIRARATRRAAEEIGQTLERKQMAYGDVASLQLGIWEVLLEQYADGSGRYVLPRSLLAHLPRLTRIFDRVGRIVSNPDGDRTGEDPWADLAGDAIVGIVMPRVERCHEPNCERGYHRNGYHARVDAAGVHHW